MTDNVVDILLRARMEASDVASGVSSIQKALNGLTLPKNVSGDLEKQFAKIGPLIKDYQKQLDKGFKTPKDLKNLELLKEKITDTFGEIKTKLQDVNGQEIRFKADTQEITKLEKELDGLQTKLKDKLSNVYKSEQTEQGIKTSINSLQKALGAQFKTGSFKFPALKELTSGLRQALNAKDFASFNSQLDNIRDKINSLSASSKINIADSLGLKYAANDANAAGREINKFLTNIQVNKTAANSIETLRTKITETGNTLQQLKFDSATRGAEALGNTSSGIDQLINSLSGAGQSAEQAASGMLSMQQQVDQLKTSTQYFFSLRNMINLLRRGISQAVDTIKELDAAMTETAVVVPEWDVGDMWAKLPEYTQNANKLGSTVVDLYKATTLYYQQGLRGNEVMDIAGETMKMARIGGLEAADATDKMTAALRGFNMEISQESARRINDVYSNLAANTASNTEELGTAMQRTASIAASAGMSFEGTAAFLAQAIETTREPAENLGTAMKTIVARFTELKKNPLEISEVDGEEVSYNKVDTALQSIGVSLKDANGQFRDLDQVFLDISQRWDSLTQTQQRYIATQAAGSRQQSRFIAMMSNYQRTTELMNFANNSEGASQEQFEKTMESLEAKMNKLKNAWDAFLMGITDNHIVKGAVDGLTGLIDGVNKLIDTLSLGFGPVKSFMSLLASFIGLKMGGRFINSTIGGLGGMIDPTSSFGAGFRGGMVGRGNPALASQIYNPIVAAIHELGAAMGHTFGNGAGVNSLFNKTADQIRYDAYKSAHQEFKNIAFNRGDYENKNATVNDLTKSLSKLDIKDQNLLGKAFFNTTNSARQATFQKWATQAFKFDKNAGTGHAAGQIYSKNAMQMLNQADKAIYANVKDNSLPLSEYFKRIQDPMTIKQALENIKGGMESPVYKYFDNLDKQGSDYAKSYIEKTNQSVIDKINNSSKLSQEQKDAAINRWKTTDHAQNARQAYFANLRHEGETPNGEEAFKNSGVAKALDHISGFGSSMATAGMGLRSFGSLLQQSANPALATFGTALTTMGSLLSGIGMGITSLTSVFSSASASIASATNLTAGAATVLAAGLFGLVAVVGSAIAMEQKRREDIKKRAEEITTNYKDKSKETTSNISDLQTWQDEMPRLAKGVDKNGNNINLDASDYQHYLEIVDRIAELNPEIVKGYNAQGHAIVDNNTALQKTLDLQRDNQKLAVEEYTSDDSIKALMEARDLNKTIGGYVGGKRTKGGKYTQIEYKESMLTPQKTMIEQAQKMVQSLKDAGLSNKDFKDFHIDLFALEQGDQVAINTLSNNIDKIKNRAKAKMQEFGDEVSDSTKEAFDKSVSGFTDAASELDEMITPLYDALSVRMSNSSVFQQIPDDMVTYFNQGLKSIAADTTLDFSGMIAESNKLSNEFANLTAKGTDYDQAMEKIAEAQEKFGENLDTAAYDRAAEDVVDDLNRIKDSVDSTSTYGQALTEFLDNQIAQIKNFTEEGEVSVSEALNTMTDEIVAAEGALESFKDVAEGSNFSTAAEGMKEIYDTITELDDETKTNKHAEGLGDQTYWAGAEALLGRDNLKNKTKEQVDGMLKTIKPMLEEGEKGFGAFYNKWISKQEELKKIEGIKLFDENSKSPGWLEKLDDDLNPDVYKQVADALDMSEDMLTSMLNKGRQFGALEFTNLDKVREGLATSDFIIRGTNSDVKGKRNMYIKQETLTAEFANAGINDVARQEKYTKRLEEEQGIKIISEAAKIGIDGIDEFKDMGIHSQESLISILNDTGQFTKDEIQEYAKTYAKVNKDAAKFNKETFDKQFEADEARKDPVAGAQLESLESIQSAVTDVVDILSDQRIEEGHLDKSLADDVEKMIFGGKGADTEAQRFAKGQNKEGELISRKEYEQTSSSMKSLMAENEEYIAKLEENRKETKAGSKERKEFDDEIKAFKNINKYLAEYLEKGKEGLRQAQDEKIAAINETNKGLLKGKTSEDFKGTKKGSALDSIYEASLEPLTTVTDSFVEDLDTLNISLKQAQEKGLVTKEAYKAYTKQNEEYLKQEEAEKAARNKRIHKETNANIDQINEKTGGALEGKTWKDFKGKGNRAAIEEVAQATQEPIQIITDGFVNSLTTVGLDLEQALASGLVTQGAYDVYTKAKALEQKKNDAEQQGKDEADAGAAAEAKTKGKDNQKKKNDAEQQGKDEANGEQSTDTLQPKSTTSPTDTSGFDDAAKGAENAANGAKAASDELEKDKDSITNVASAVTSGLNYANKGIKTFIQNAKEASSPSLQGKPKEKGTTIPGVGYVVNGKPTASPKKDEKQSGVGDQTVTLKVNADYTQVDEAKKAVNSTIKLTKKPARLFVNATIGKNIGKAQKALNALKQSSGQKVSSSVKVNSTGDTSGIKTITKAASSAKSSVLVTANTTPAYQKINALISSINGKTANVDVNVWPHYKGTWKKEVYVSKTGPGAATGQNNTGAVPSLPNLGSAATGTSKPGTGRIGPKGKGGLTLTGELGYEVAWLPRQRRSMILGAKGPEMVNLPKDAVIWNHEQSKQIVKKNQIPSGSAAIGAGSAAKNVTGSEYEPTYTGTNNNVITGGRVTQSGTIKSNKKNNKSTEKILKQTWKLLNTAGKISNWWENISRKVEGAQRISDRNQKAFKKLIDTAGTTLKGVQISARKYAASLRNTISLNQQIVSKYTKQLDKLDNGSGSVKQRNNQRKKINKVSNKVTKAQAKVELAEKTKSKKDDKNAKKALKKAKKALKTAKKKGKNVDTVTYDNTILTTTIKKVKGKKKKVKSKEKVKSTRAVDWSSIIKYDAKNDTWVLNDKAINKQAGGNKNAAKAIKEKGNKLIDEKVSRRNTAQDKIDAAREALDQLAEDTYNMFNRWEKSITEIYFISQQLERLQKRSDIYSAQEEYLSTKAKTGYNPEDALDRLTTVLTNERNNLVEQAKANSALVDHTFKQYQDALTLESYVLNNNGSDVNGGTSLASQNEREAANIVFKVMKDLGLDSPETFNRGNLEKAVGKYRAKNYTNTTDEEVKKVIDRIAEYEGAYLDAIKETYSSVTEIYAKLDEYREFVNDFEESLLKGLEEELNDEIDRQEKLNSALTDAFKDLLDEVKRRLDQRRQAEDNAKTESDIAKKQQRLAVLRADTSGGHASEIKQLEQELADAQQSYGRTLEDQLLERLQDQGDKAAKQRERQIKLLEIQRDLAQALGTNLEEVKEWLKDPDKYKEQIKQAWLANQEYDEALPDEQQSLLRQFEDEWTKYGAYSKSIEAYEEILDRVNGVGGESPVENIETSVQNIEEELGGFTGSLEGWMKGDLKENTDEEGNKQTAHINTEGTVEGIQALKKQGLNAKQIKDYGKDVGITYSNSQLKEAGFNAADFNKSGLSIKDAVKAGFNYNQLTTSGAFTYKDILKNQDAIHEYEGGQKLVKAAEKEQFLKQITNITKQIDPNNPTNKSKNGISDSLISTLPKKSVERLKTEFKGKAFSMKSGNGHIHSNGLLYFSDKKGNVKKYNFNTGKFSNVSFNQKKWEKHAGYKQESDTPYIKAEFQAALKKRFPKKGYKFAQGGLATVTGPAWLDGTRAKPELVLNATDTKNFIALKDVLSSVMNGVNSMTDVSDVQGAPVTYDININVDHLNNDYDVDRVADRVKKIIVQDASYRNVTAVRKFR